MAQRYSQQFPRLYERDVTFVLGSVFFSTGSAAPVIRRAHGLAAVTRELTGTYKFKFSESFPSASLLSFHVTPWLSSTNGPNTIEFQLKHADETNPTGAEVFVQLISGTQTTGTTGALAVSDPSVHLTGSFDAIFGKQRY